MSKKVKQCKTNSPFHFVKGIVGKEDKAFYPEKFKFWISVTVFQKLIIKKLGVIMKSQRKLSRLKTKTKNS